MFRKILIYGLAAGLLVGIPLSAIVTMAGHEQQPYGMLIGYTIMLVALSMVFVAIKRYRDVDLGGVIGFWPALAMGLGVSFIAGVIYVAAWEAAQALTNMHFAHQYAQMMIADAKAKGEAGAALAKAVADAHQFETDYANPLYRWPMTFIEIFPVGVLVSLISAALLRNRRFLPVQHAN
jgi:hypothetical protein